MENDTIKKFPSNIIELAESYPNFIKTHNDYDFKFILGHGGYGVIYLGIDKKTNKEVAIKQFLEKRAERKIISSFIKEVYSLLLCRKNNFISQILGFIVDKPYSIVMQYENFKDLSVNIKNYFVTNSISGTNLTKLAIGICNAVKHIHSLGLIHRDLKTSNVLLNDKMVPRISDFGISKFFYDLPLSQRVGTPNFMAPEVCYGNNYNTKADIYGLGVILYEMSEFVHIYHDLSRSEIFNILKRSSPKVDFTDKTPKHLKELILRCLSHNPDERPTADEVYELFCTGKVAFRNSDYHEVVKYVEILHNIEISNNEIPETTVDVKKKIKNIKYIMADFVPPKSILKYTNVGRICNANSCSDVPNSQSTDFENLNEYIKDFSENITYERAQEYFDTLKPLIITSELDAKTYFLNCLFVAMKRSTTLIEIVTKDGLIFDLHPNSNLSEYNTICLSLYRVIVDMRPDLLTTKALGSLNDFSKTHVKEVISLYELYSSKEMPLLYSLSVNKLFLSLEGFKSDVNNAKLFMITLYNTLKTRKIIANSFKSEIEIYLNILLQCREQDIIKLVLSYFKDIMNHFKLDTEVLHSLYSDERLKEIIFLLYAYNNNIIPYPNNFLVDLIRYSTTNPTGHIIICNLLERRLDTEYVFCTNSSWLIQLPTYEDTLKIVLVLYKKEKNISLINESFFSDFAAFLNNLIYQTEDVNSLIGVNIVLDLNKSPSLIPYLNSTNALSIFLAKCYKNQDSNAAFIGIILNVIDNALNYSYNKDFENYIQFFISLINSETLYSKRSLYLIVKMTDYTQGSIALSKMNLEDYFRKLQESDEFRSIASTFLYNIENII